MMMRFALACSFLLAASEVLAGSGPPLESYNVDTSQLTVSGLSAGGALATQANKTM